MYIDTYIHKYVSKTVKWSVKYMSIKLCEYVSVLCVCMFICLGIYLPISI